MACVNDAQQRGVDMKSFMHITRPEQFLGLSSKDVKCIYAGEYDKYSNELYTEALKYFTTH